MARPGYFPFLVASIFFASAAALLIIYHVILFRWCKNTRQDNVTDQAVPGNPVTEIQESPSRFTDSINELIPTYKFSKGIIGMECSESYDQEVITCAVCLCEVEDGESIRVLPECLHLFHVACIDMWLYSHSSCPLCRADTPVHDIAAGL